MTNIIAEEVKPVFTGVVTTCDMWEAMGEKDGLLDTDKQQGTVKPHQKVIAVGDSCRNVKVGDLVVINPSRFAIRQYADNSLKDGIVKENVTIGYNFPIIEVNEKPCLLLTENDISYIIEKYKEVEIEDTPDIIK